MKSYQRILAVGVGVLAVVAVIAVTRSRWSGRPAAGRTATGDACVHDAPPADCFICDPALREKGRLWCAEHHRYEDRCWLCHPDLQEKKRLWCEEHSLYEDECFLCHPELKKSLRVSPAGASTKLMCAEHGVPEAVCGICHPEIVAGLPPGQGVQVRLPHSQSARLVGVRTTQPVQGGLTGGIECYAELVFDQNKFANIPAPVGGVVKEVLADLGATVGERQALARMWSAQIAETVAKAVLSHQVLTRERDLHAKGITSTKDLQEAQAAHRTICQQARALGFSEEEVEAMGTTPEGEVLLEIRTPFAGEVVERHAIRGAQIEAGAPLFTVADRRVMWAMLSVPEAALPHLSPGQSVEVRIDALPGRTFTGTLTWIAADVDEKSRLGRARVELPNPGGVLRARMFGRGRILMPRPGKALLVPAGAIQHIEGHAVAFVKQGEDLYEARRVRLGARTGSHVEVLEGLRPGDPVVGANSFMLKSQLLSSRLGKGCVD